MSSERPGGQEPSYAEHPGYGIWPCRNPWHSTRKSLDEPTGACPDCPNGWWAVDGSECPEEYALLAEIDWLRNTRCDVLAERERVTRIIREHRDKCLAVAASHYAGESWLAPPWEEKAQVYAELLVALRVEDSKPETAVNEDGA